MTTHMTKYLVWMVPLLIFVSMQAYGSGEKLVGTWEMDWEATQKKMKGHVSTMPAAAKQHANAEAVMEKMKATAMSSRMELRADETGKTETMMQGTRTEEKFSWRVLKEKGGVFTVEMVRQNQEKDTQGQANEETKVISHVQIKLIADDVLHFENPPTVWKRVK